MESPISCNQRPASQRSSQGAVGSASSEKTPAASLYSAFLKAENKVGGGEGLEGVYGSITRVGTTKVLDALKQHASLGERSVMLDIGSGLGRPLLHAILHSGVAATYGIEVDAVKCQKAVPFVQHVVADMGGHGVSLPASSLPKFICVPIEKVPSLEPATHVYAAWEGFSRDAMEAVGALFAASRTAKAITIVQRSFRQRDADEEMEEMGFGKVRLVAEMAVAMAGSRRQLMAYCFVKVEAEASGPAPPAGNGLAPCPSGDLSTMPAFQPEHVIDVLTSQASERKEEGCARAAAAAKKVPGTAGAGSDTQNVRDKAAPSPAAAARGGRGCRAATRAAATAATSESNSQASDETTAGAAAARRTRA